MDIKALCNDIISHAQHRNHRLCLVISGDKSWTDETGKTIYHHFEPLNRLWLTESTSPSTKINTLSARQATQKLGQETDIVIYDCWSGFNPDAVGAITGTIRGGGLFVLLTPILSEWHQYPDPGYLKLTPFGAEGHRFSGHYLYRIANLLQNSDEVVRLHQSGKIENCPAQTKVTDEISVAPLDDSLFRTNDQQLAVEKTLRVLDGQRKKPLLISSDRGRGKSAALGIAAKILMSRPIDQRPKSIIVTGPSYHAVNTVFLHAEKSSADTTSILRYVSIEELLKDQPETDLLMIDEAATIHLGALSALLDRYPRIVFSTTIHGYEGTGRGFVTRFKDILGTKTRGVKMLQLTTPIRWNADDMLEQLTFDLLLLNAESEFYPTPQIEDLQTLTFQCLTQFELRENENLLRAVFGLLVLAHYRTRPFDLRYLLDAPNIKIVVLKHSEHIIGVALVSYEGGIGHEYSDPIWSGDKRPHGQFLPVSVAHHLGFKSASELNAARIIRIVIHPNYQQKGLGTLLTRYIDSMNNDSSLDYSGCSFGVSPHLIGFWSKLNYYPVRLGFKQSPNSGAYSLLCLRGHSHQGIELVETARNQFSENFLAQITSTHQDLDSTLVQEILLNLPTIVTHLSSSDLLHLNSIAYGNRNPDSALMPIKRLILTASLHSNQFKDSEINYLLLIEHYLMAKPLNNCNCLTDQDNRANAITTIRNSLKNLITFYSELRE